jgi:uncharacterized repeat protein (TIGR01451 family)
MSTYSILTGAAVFLFAAPVLAAADVRVQIPAPAAVHVHDTSDYDVVVSNIGNKKATGVQLVIELPETNTSPQVYVMGTVSGIDPRCVASGTSLVCSLGDIARNAQTVVSFGIALPWADEELAVTATATSTSAESTLANNSATDVAALLHYAVAVQPGDLAINRHCTGTGLTSFYECELFPSSISEHEAELLADGVISIPGEPGFTGTWSQPTPDSLVMTYVEIGVGVVAELHAFGTSLDCFEGITTFPGSTYVAPYEVCI